MNKWKGILQVGDGTDFLHRQSLVSVEHPPSFHPPTQEITPACRNAYLSTGRHGLARGAP